MIAQAQYTITQINDGEKGASSYTHIRYSENANGSPMVTIPTASTSYIGISVTTSSTAPTSYTSYSWTKIKGDPGEPGGPGQPGSPGDPGEDGLSAYVHIKYSNNGTSFTPNNGEDIGDYLGVYVDHNETDSMDFSKYNWKKIVGQAGTPAYTVFLTNETQTIATNTELKPLSASTFSTSIRVYRGTTALTATTGTPTSTQFKVITPSNATGITVEQAIAGTLTFTVGTSTAINTNGEIPITIVTSDSTFDKSFSYAASKQGNIGVSAVLADIACSAQIFKSTDNGLTFSPDTITLTANLQNCTLLKWQYSINGGASYTDAVTGTNGLVISGSTLTIASSSSLYNSNTSVSFKVITNQASATDTITIAKLQDITDAQIGVRNLVTNTNNGVGSWAVTKSSGTFTLSSVTVNGINSCRLTVAAVSTGIPFLTHPIENAFFKQATVYTISLTVTCSVASTLTLGLADSPANNIFCSFGSITVPANTATVIKKTAISHPTLAPTGRKLCLHGINTAGAIITLSDLIIAEGNVISNWSPSPEDITNQINTKSKVYFQNEQPGGAGYRTGDVWFDTNDGNKVHLWNGSSWSLSEFGASAVDIPNLRSNLFVADKILATEIDVVDLSALNATIGGWNILSDGISKNGLKLDSANQEISITGNSVNRTYTTKLKDGEFLGNSDETTTTARYLQDVILNHNQLYIAKEVIPVNTSEPTTLTEHLIGNDWSGFNATYMEDYSIVKRATYGYNGAEIKNQITGNISFLDTFQVGIKKNGQFTGIDVIGTPSLYENGVSLVNKYAAVIHGHAIENITNLRNELDNLLNVYLPNALNQSNSNAAMITTYPTTPGLYRVSNRVVPGTPEDVSLYGALMIVSCGQYLIHLYVTPNNIAYIAFTSVLSGVYVPTSWRNITEPMVTLSGQYNINALPYNANPTNVDFSYAIINGGSNPFQSGTIPTVSLGLIFPTSVPHQRMANLVNPTENGFTMQLVNFYNSGTWTGQVRWSVTGMRGPTPSRS